jgi:hypothetical protein
MKLEEKQLHTCIRCGARFRSDRPQKRCANMNKLCKLIRLGLQVHHRSSAAS